mgnify:CR=1 FL=1
MTFFRNPVQPRPPLFPTQTCSTVSPVIDLDQAYEDMNIRFFDGFLPAPELAWNSRLRSSAGRFLPGVRRGPWSRPARIEVAGYLREESNAVELIVDTMGHEMIHYWLWLMGRPYGHTPEFLAKMKEMGVSRYNSVPRVRPYKYLYRCPECLKSFPARRRLGPLACASCCRRHGSGKFDHRFKLVMVVTSESVEVPRQAERPSAEA